MVDNRLTPLKRTLITLSLANLLVVAVSGVLLRAIPVFELSIPYKYLLHGHSHFAFGGWVTPVLVWMIMNYFPEITRSIPYRHWLNIVLLLMGSAYGMLLSFPFQGYGLVSIVFSTLSISATFYLAAILWIPLSRHTQTSARFLKAALVFLVISSIGPFATGPIIATENSGTPVYYNAIYFYLHFQYNGWFTFAIFSYIYKELEQQNSSGNGTKVFVLLAIGCILTYFLSVLWNKPNPLYNMIGGVGAIFQIVALRFFLHDFIATDKNRFTRILLRIVVAAFIMKILLQAVSAFPFVAALAYTHRNFIIAYLHLVMLGFVTLFAFYTIIRRQRRYLVLLRAPVTIFLWAFIVSELLLVIQAFSEFYHIYFPLFNETIFGISLLFPLSTLLIFFRYTHRPVVNNLIPGV